MSKIKNINGVKVPPLFYEKRWFKGAFISAMIGLAGVTISLVRYLIYFNNSEKNITETDVWEIFVLSLFILAMSLPTSLILYFSHTIIKILENLTENNPKRQIG